MDGESHYDASLLTDAALPLAVRIQAQPSHRPHDHEFTELVVVLRGTGEHLLDDERHPLFPGAVFAVRPPSRHAYASSEGLELANILFDEGWFASRMPELSSSPAYRALVQVEPAARLKAGIGARLGLGPQELAVVRDILGSLESELRSASFSAVRAERANPVDEARAAAVALLITLMVKLCRAYRALGNPRSEAVLGIARAIATIEADLGRRLDPAALASIAGMSERSFHRQFRSFAGKSPGEHQLESRISLAERLLSTTALPITEIAFRAGFSDGNYFSRSFGKARSVSPREYRRRNRMQVR